jgi:hypothetical protein
MSTLGVWEVRAKLEVHCRYLLPVVPEESFFSDKEHAPREAGRLVPSRRHTSPSLLRVWAINQRDSVLDCGGRDARRKPASATPLSPDSRASFEPSALTSPLKPGRQGGWSSNRRPAFPQHPKPSPNPAPFCSTGFSRNPEKTTATIYHHLPPHPALPQPNHKS